MTPCDSTTNRYLAEKILIYTNIEGVSQLQTHRESTTITMTNKESCRLGNGAADPPLLPSTPGVSGDVGGSLPVVGLAVVGLAVDGLAVDGLAVDGLAVVGLAVDGLAVDGLAVDELAVDGLAVDGLAVDVESRKL